MDKKPFCKNQAGDTVQKEIEGTEKEGSFHLQIKYGSV
jgi:hypothetical protein